VTAASNIFGTRPDVAEVSRAAREAGALVYVDAVHLAAHAPVDMVDLGADLLACSPYKFFGPHLGVLAADPALLETLHPDKLLPSSDAVPERFELGTLPYELLAGVTASVEFAEECRMAAVETHEQELLTQLLEGLTAVPRVQVHGTPVRRTPTVLLTVDGLTPLEVSDRLVERGVVAPAGSFYALAAAKHAGLGVEGGVRVGLSAYTSPEEIGRLVTALGEIAG
jgi:selenocysteine lyase/cysteine desulfurase